MPDGFLQVTVGKFIFRVKPGCLYTESGVWACWRLHPAWLALG